MGTTTFFLRHNDTGKRLTEMSKEELEKLDNLSPYIKTPYCFGWNVPVELHNGNVYVLVFWKGRFMKIEDAPKVLNKKYYDKYRGKEINSYEWTILRRYLLAQIEWLDKEFKKSIRKKKSSVSKRKK